MKTVIGTCSLCGGEVVAWRGAWAGVDQPPLARCTNCGATAAAGPVIPMVRPVVRPITRPVIREVVVPVVEPVAIRPEWLWDPSSGPIWTS